MSGLEPLAALGLACNVMQLISFGRETVSTCQAVFRTGSPDTSLDRFAKNLNSALVGVETALPSGPRESLGEADKALLDVANGCKAAATELLAEVQAASAAGAKGKGKVLRAAWVALRSRSREKKVGELEKSLQSYQKVLETGLLLRISRNTNPGALMKTSDFQHLDQAQKSFVDALAREEFQMSKLFWQHTSSIKEHVTTEATKAVAGVTHRLDADAALKLQKKLLQSLKYEAMNSRRNAVTDAHDETFGWIFKERNISRPASFKGAESASSSYPDGYFLATFDANLSDWDRFFGVVGDASDCSESEAAFDEPEPSVDEDLDRAISGNHSGSTFHAWLQSGDSSLFWISGKPGSGKSTLVKFLLHDPRTQAALNVSHPNTLIMSHFIWAAGQPLERSIKGIYYSLLHQLFTHDIGLLACMADCVEDVSTRDCPHDWSEKELESVLFRCLDMSTRHKCLFLDGMDEIDRTVGAGRLLDLVQALSCAPRLKVCAASRPEKAFEDRLAQLPMLRVQDLTMADISRFASDRLKHHFETNPSQIALWRREQLRDLHKALCEKSDGVFLWVALVLGILSRGLTNGDRVDVLRRRLLLLPQGLNDLYKNMWARLNEDQVLYREEAARIFNSVIDTLEHTNGYLEGASVAQLLLADSSSWTDIIDKRCSTFNLQSFEAACQDFAGRIKTRCAGLLEIRGEESEVFFIHRSAKEFLEAGSDGNSVLSFDNRGVNYRHTRRFISSLSLWKLRQNFASPRFFRTVASEPSLHGIACYGLCYLLDNLVRVPQSSSLSTGQVQELVRRLVETIDSAVKLLHNSDGHRLDPIPDGLGSMTRTCSPSLLAIAIEEQTARGIFTEEYKAYLLLQATSEARIDFDIGFRRISQFRRLGASPIISAFKPRLLTHMPFVDFSHRFWVLRSPLKDILLHVGLHSRRWEAYGADILGLIASSIDTGGNLSANSIFTVRLSIVPNSPLRPIFYPDIKLSSGRDFVSVIMEANPAFLLERILRRCASFLGEAETRDLVLRNQSLAAYQTPARATVIGLVEPGIEASRWIVPEGAASQCIIDELETTRWWFGDEIDQLEAPVAPAANASIIAAREHGKKTTREALIGLLVAKGVFIRASPDVEWFPKKYVDK